MNREITLAKEGRRNVKGQIGDHGRDNSQRQKVAYTQSIIYARLGLNMSSHPGMRELGVNVSAQRSISQHPTSRPRPNLLQPSWCIACHATGKQCRDFREWRECVGGQCLRSSLDRSKLGVAEKLCHLLHSISYQLSISRKTQLHFENKHGKPMKRSFKVSEVGKAILSVPQMLALAWHQAADTQFVAHAPKCSPSSHKNYPDCSSLIYHMHFGDIQQELLPSCIVLNLQGRIVGSCAPTAIQVGVTIGRGARDKSLELKIMGTINMITGYDGAIAAPTKDCERLFKSKWAQHVHVRSSPAKFVLRTDPETSSKEAASQVATCLERPVSNRSLLVGSHTRRY